MQTQLTFLHGVSLYTLYIAAGVFHCAAQVPDLPANLGTASPPSATPPTVLNQPVVVNSSEKVEMERLRLTEEAAKTVREEADFEAQRAKLQKKLASSSLGVIAPESVPTDFRTFLSINEGRVEMSRKYHALLKSALNDLTPQSPYLVRAAGEGTNPGRANATLLTLDGYPEDDGMSRTLRGHIGELFEGRGADAKRLQEINQSLAALDVEKKRLQNNYKVGSGTNAINGQRRATEADLIFLQEQITAATQNEVELHKELLTRRATITEVQRKLQFQQFIVELALQQRYIHALIGCGFYRVFAANGDLSIDPKAFDSDRNKAPTTPQSSASTLNPTAGSIPSAQLPVISTISGMEAWLTTRIRDAMREREAMDNLLKEKQMSAAEGLLLKMVMTAKYQPELNTIPYSSRQLIHAYRQDMRSLMDALNAKDYVEMKKIATRIEATSTDAGMKDIRLFAEEHPKRALYLVNQAEVALKIGEFKSAHAMMDAAMQRAPLDPDVNARIQGLQSSFLSNTKLAEELERIAQAGDYQTLGRRKNELGPFILGASDKALKARVEKLIQQETSVVTALEKCDAFERRSSYPDAWVALCSVEQTLAEDSRLVKRKNAISGKCPRFISAYTNATDHEQKGAMSIALAWYLSALAEAPGNIELVERVNVIGAKVLNH